MKTDYTFDIRKLIASNYSPVLSLFEENEYTEKKTLEDVYVEVTSILPKEWVHKSEVYEILQELGFKSFSYTFPPIQNIEGKVLVPERTTLVYLLERKTAAI